MQPFVGRESELKRLRNLFDEALNYAGTVAVIRGDVGVGKSRLLREFTDLMASQKVWTLSGKSLKDDVRPLSPFLQMMEAQLEKIEYRPQWLIRFIEPELFPYLADLLPKVKSRYPLEVPSIASQYGEKRLLFDAVERFLANLSKRNPLILVLDDILWMGEYSLELLKYLAFRIADKAILVISAARPWRKNTPFQEFIDELTARRTVHILDLENLSEAETEDLLIGQFGAQISSKFISWLFHVTKGNPLFIREVINVLLRQNILRYSTHEERWSVGDDYEDFPISPTIESVIKLRINNLTEGELLLLETASALGEEFEPAVLYRLLSGIRKHRFLKALNRLRAERLLEEVRANLLRFSHPLIRELLYRGMGKTKRQRLHRKVGHVLEGTKGAQIEEIAHHLTVDLTEEEETPDFCRYLLRIGRAILHRYNEQLGWRCLTLAGKIVRRFPEELRKEGLEIQAELSRLRWVLGRDPPSIEETEELIDRLKTSGLREEAVMLYLILFARAMDALDLDSAERYVEDGLSLALKSNENFWLLKADGCKLKISRGRFEEAEEECLELIKEIDPLIAPGALWKALSNLGVIAFSRGDLKTAYKFWFNALGVAEQHNLTLVRATSYANSGYIEMKLGHLNSALAKLSKALKEAQSSGRTQKIAAYSVLLGRCLVAKGEFESAVKYFDDCMRRAEEIGFKRAVSIARLSRAEALLEVGKIDEALSELNSIPTKGLGKDWLCDVHLLKSRVWFEKQDLRLSEEEIRNSLNLARKLSLGIKMAHCLAQKGMIFLRKENKEDALAFLEKAKEILLKKGALADQGLVLTRFGFALGGPEGDQTVKEGLKILYDIGALPRVEYLLPRMKERGFEQSSSLAQKKLGKERKTEERLEINTFGGLSVRRPGELDRIPQSEWQSRKARELLGLLLVLSEPKGATRETLASHLWPEADTERAQANFRVTLSRLTHTLGHGCIRQEAEFLSLEKDLVSVDFWEFQDLFNEWSTFKEQGKLHPAEKKARQAVALHRADFLPEFYETPIEDKQIELRGKQKRMLSWLAERSLDRLDWQEAISLAHRLISLDSCDERAHRVIMEGLWSQGDRSGAIRQFERLRSNLETELGVSPSPETLELKARIVRGEA